MVHSDVLNGSFFKCSDILINKLHALCVQTFKSNLLSVPTDCPHRERNGWLGDALCVSEAECLNFDMALFYRKWFSDIEDSQHANGEVPWIAPYESYKDRNYTHMDLPWGAAVIIVPWDAYMAIGDIRLLENLYVSMGKWIESLKTLQNSQYIIEDGVMWGDHTSTCQPSKQYLGSIYYYRCVYLMAKIASEVGNMDDVLRYSMLAEKIRSGIQRSFYLGDGSYDNNSQSSNAHAVYFGIAVGNEKKDTLNKIIEDIREKSLLTTGCLGNYCLLSALSDNGYNDFVYSLVKNTKKGFWGYWVISANLSIDIV